MKSWWFVNLLFFNEFLYYRKDTNMSIWGHDKTYKSEMMPAGLEMEMSVMKSNVGGRATNWE